MTDTALYADVSCRRRRSSRATTSRRRYGPITSSSAGRSSTPSAKRDRTPTCSASCASRLGVLARTSRRASWTCWSRCSTRCPETIGATCARAPGPRRRSATAPDPVRGCVPEHAGPEGPSVPGGARASAPAGLYRFQPDPATERLSAGAHLAGQRAHDQLDARRAAAARRQADDASRRRSGARAGGRRSASASSTTSARCTAPLDVRRRSARHGEPAEGLWRRSTRNGATGNALVPDTLTDIGGGACFNDARVQVASLPTLEFE